MYDMSLTELTTARRAAAAELEQADAVAKAAFDRWYDADADTEPQAWTEYEQAADRARESARTVRSLTP
jgi:hypothetical protein